MKTIHLTDQQYEDLMWAANEGAEQVFGFTDPDVDWEMTHDEFFNWNRRINDALIAARAHAE